MAVTTQTELRYVYCEPAARAAQRECPAWAVGYL